MEIQKKVLIIHCHTVNILLLLSVKYLSRLCLPTRRSYSHELKRLKHFYASFNCHTNNVNAVTVVMVNCETTICHQMFAHAELSFWTKLLLANHIYYTTNYCAAIFLIRMFFQWGKEQTVHFLVLWVVFIVCSFFSSLLSFLVNENR